MSSKNNEWGCCGGSNKEDNGYILCNTCRKTFHLACLTSSTVNPQNLIEPSWNCPTCTTPQPKNPNNDETPVRFNPNITIRATKRQALQSPPDNASEYTFKEDMRSVVQEVVRKEIDGLNTNLSNSLQLFSTELRAVMNEMKDIKDSMNFMNSKFEDVLKEQAEVKKTLSDLKVENLTPKNTIKDVCTRLNMLEQNARSNNVEIQCIPEKKNENIVEIITNIGKVINCNISRDNISHCTRIAKLNPGSTRPRSIVAQFNTIQSRNLFMAAAINFNKPKPIHDKLNSSHLGYEGSKTPIFITDHLSPTNRALHIAARSAAKEKGYKYVWIKNGRIYMRKSDKANCITIKDMDTIHKLK
ncbi:unnamed protein product [Parnassius mnemosyne]|uniref:PHD-type domain-containing protein n=1 Tax=Parnassius mnemosyne TaxID=213953 RepID=A0AAV1LMC2_9NEOP